MENKIDYSLGSDPIRKQLLNQQISFDSGKIKIVDKLYYEVLSLRFYQIISDQTMQESIEKIHDRLLDAVWIQSDQNSRKPIHLSISK